MVTQQRENPIQSSIILFYHPSEAWEKNPNLKINKIQVKTLYLPTDR